EGTFWGDGRSKKTVYDRPSRWIWHRRSESVSRGGQGGGASRFPTGRNAAGGKNRRSPNGLSENFRGEEPDGRARLQPSAGRKDTILRRQSPGCRASIAEVILSSSCGAITAPHEWPPRISRAASKLNDR